MFGMNFYAASALFVCLTSFASGLMVFLKNPHGKKNRIFQLFAIGAFFWSFFYIFWQMSDTPEKALFFIRLSIASAVWIPATHFHAILEILEANTPRRILFRNFFYAVTIIIFIFTPTQYFIPRVEQKLDFPFWPVPGFFIHLHFINLLIPSMWTLYLIWEKKSQVSALQRNKMKWIMVGFLVGYSGGLSNNFLWYDIPIKPYISFLSSMALIMTASSYFRLAIVDLNFLLKKLFIFSLSLLVSSILPLLLYQLPFMKLSPVWMILFSIAIGSVLFPVINKWVDRLIRRYVFRDQFTKTSLQSNSEKIKESTYTYNDLAINTVNLVMNTFLVENAAVYFFDIKRREFYLCYQKGMKSKLAKDLRFNRGALTIPFADPLVTYLEKNKKMVQFEELFNEREIPELQPLVQEMKNLEAEICAPFIFGERLRGFLVIGKKRDNTLYNEDELEILLSFAGMGTEIMRTIMGVETELNHVALYSHDMNHNIRSLTQTIQFLQSPLIKQQPPEKVEKLLKQAEAVAGNLYASFQSNQDRSALIMKTIRGEYEKSPMNIAKVLQTSSEKFILMGEKSGGRIKTSIEPSPQEILGNETDLARVFDNIIVNAFRYLPETNGLLEISGKNGKEGYEISIRDNGEGIPPEDLEKIWILGWQGIESNKGSSGFGLGIGKQIIQVHGGTINATSQGKGTGVEFKIFLPYKEES